MRHWLIRKRQPAPNSSHAEFACGGLTAAATDPLVPEVDSLTALYERRYPESDATARSYAQGKKMINVPSGTELARPFVPAKDLELAKRFYVKLGFEKVLDGDVVVFRVGSSGFVLSSFDQAENFMMQLMVDDLEAWWSHIKSLDLETEFGVPAPSAPALQPWGLRIAYLVDPSGVLWHVAQRRPGKPQDI